MNYRAEIDGLRAIAVVSVILYHAEIVIFGRDWFEGGYIGVDIFFVISGYLITRIILTELEQTNTFSFIKFYERRARRILPMLLFVIGVCLPFAWQELLPLDLVEFAKSALSAIGFGSNFFFYFSTTEYGADLALLKPLLHTWSLGVEEQFYIIVPMIILVIWKFARASLLTLLIGMLIISIQFADVMDVRNSELNFFLPFSRFWEMLVGSVLALIELKYGRSKNPILTQSLPIIGLFLIAHSILFFNAKTPHPSFHTVIPILGVALVLAFSSKEDIVGKLLCFKPIAGIGFISYSLYLWHFPIFAFGRIGSSNPSTYDKIEWICLAFVFSIISYFLIEKTFRNRTVVSGKLFFGAIVISISTLTYVNFDFISKGGHKGRIASILTKENLAEQTWLRYIKNGKQCHNRTENFCVENQNLELTTVYNFGDSHLASSALELSEALKEKFRVVTSTVGGCPFFLNISSVQDNKVGKRCSQAFQRQRLELISNADSIVVIFARYPVVLERSLFDNMEGGKESGDPSFWQANDGGSLQKSIIDSMNALIERGAKVVLVYPLPEVGFHVPKQLLKTIKNRDISSVNKNFATLTTSFEVYKKRSASTFELFDSIQSPNVYRVYPHTLFCDKQIKGRCVTHDNEDVFYADDDHPSAKGSEMIVELIMKQIENAEADIKGN